MIRLAMEVPGRRVTRVVMALNLLLKLVLSDEVLVPRSVVVVREELRQ